VRDIWPGRHRHPFRSLEWTAHVTAPVPATLVFRGFLGGPLVSIVLVLPGCFLILFLLSLGAARDILFPFHLGPCLRQYVFHGLALVLGEFFIEIPVWEQAFFERLDCRSDVAFGDRYLFLIEASYIIAKGFDPMLEDFVEAV